MRNRKRTVTLPLIAASALLAAMPGEAGNGPGIQLAAHTVSSSCSGASVTMDIDVAVTATSGAPLTLFVSAGGGFVDAGPLAWNSHGRSRAAEDTLQVTIAPGVQAVGICVSQPGADGNSARNACVTVPAAPPCDGGSGIDGV